jgi:hypothetical protein
MSLSTTAVRIKVTLRDAKPEVMRGLLEPPTLALIGCIARQSVSSDEPPNLNISIRVGEAVPSRVRLHPLPPDIVSIETEYRDYEYFSTDDDIVIVEPGSKYSQRGASRSFARPCPVERRLHCSWWRKGQRRQRRRRLQGHATGCIRQ